MDYLNDVFCFHGTFDKHLQGTQKLLEMVRRARFKLSGKKCLFAKCSVRFLGHVIDNTGVRLRLEKLDIIRNWKAPESDDQLRHFWGCAHLEEIHERLSRNSSPTSHSFNKEQFLWANECPDAFDLLKERLCSSGTLKLPQRVDRFSVTCDASDLLLFTTWSRLIDLAESAQLRSTEGNCIKPK